MGTIYLYIYIYTYIHRARANEGGFHETVAYLTVPKVKLFRGATRDEIRENWEEVPEAKAKEIKGLYELGCFEVWFRLRSNSIIDVRCMVGEQMIEGTVGVKCRLTVRRFKDQF